MSNHTSFKIGGPASVVVVPDTIEDLCEIIKALKDTKYTVMGNGTNLLVSDKGFDGTVVKISGGLNEISVSDTVITAGAGALLSKVGAVAKQNSLSGFEFASGIPGTVGGAVFMNAGAYGGEMKDIVVSSTYVDSQGNTGEITEHNFGYRTSIYKGTDKYVVSAKFKLEKGDSKEIADKMLDLAHRRAEKQPLEYPSAGSVFKRPEGYFAGALIEQAGLKGKQIGGACVSEKHSGFIINKGGATCDDVLKLIDFVRETVEKQFGVTLEQEIRLL
ncbi:MAG: UDP-N-acetylmuramate dehydrogenase [Clostridia bacterium]|nr:UDP-N-acetylmuramate dehydrogenase [Clostridia bacterium]